MGRAARRRARARQARRAGRALPQEAEAPALPSADAGPVVLLDADAAVSCPVRTRNRFDPSVPDPGPVAPQERDEEAAEFRGRVLDALAAMGRSVDLRGLGDDRQARLRATADAVRAGRRVIIAPALPPDLVGGRTGEPDVLVLGEPAAGGGHGYDPVLIVDHQVLEAASPSRSQRAALLARGLRLVRIPGTEVRPTREHDLLRLAHHRRLLEAAGWAGGGAAHGGLIGTDRISCERGSPVVLRTPRRPAPPPSRLALVWADLGSRRLRTEARTASRGWRLHSSLDRYDHEFGFRHRIAVEAAGLAPAPASAPRVLPVVTAECRTCPWWSWCRPQLADDDLSLCIDKARLGAREISLLRDMGVWTVPDLAGSDVESLVTALRPQVPHPDETARRLRLAARRARMIGAGHLVERTTAGPLRLPPAGRAIDLDIETSPDDRVYLWGFLVDDPDEAGGPRYVSFARFTDLDGPGELALACEAMAWLDAELTAHPRTMVYHYSDYEVIHIRRIAAAADDPALSTAAHGWCRTNFFDLFALVRGNFFGVHGLGLKRIAHDGAGFTWRDTEAGGLNSQAWFHEAVHAEDEEHRRAAARRVLDYNEDDVRATHALRAWLRTLGREPDSAEKPVERHPGEEADGEDELAEAR